MRKTLISFGLIVLIVSSTMLPAAQQTAELNFKKLTKSQTGKHILNAIQIELSSSNQENIVNRILDLLNELLTQQSEQHTQAEKDLENKISNCDATQKSFSDQIENKKSEILTALNRLPELEDKFESDFYQKSVEEGKQSDAENELVAVNTVNDKATATYEKSVRNHNAMLEALRQARALIVQLQSSTFLQKNEKIFVQLKEHKANTLSLIQEHKNRGVFNILMQMAQEIGVQADQILVTSVIEIIDDLMKHEQGTLDLEIADETVRVEEYKTKVGQLESAISAAKAEILRLEAELTHTDNLIISTKADIEQWQSQLKALEELLAESQHQCSVDIKNFEDLLVELSEQIDIIKQVIAIFEGEAIQDIKSVVENLEL